MNNILTLSFGKNTLVSLDICRMIQLMNGYSFSPCYCESFGQFHVKTIYTNHRKSIPNCADPHKMFKC